MTLFFLLFFVSIPKRIQPQAFESLNHWSALCSLSIFTSIRCIDIDIYTGLGWRRWRHQHRHGAAAAMTTASSRCCGGGDTDDINTGLWRCRRWRPIRVAYIVYIYVCINYLYQICMIDGMQNMYYYERRLLGAGAPAEIFDRSAP